MLEALGSLTCLGKNISSSSPELIGVQEESGELNEINTPRASTCFRHPYSPYSKREAGLRLVLSQRLIFWKVKQGIYQTITERIGGVPVGTA